MKSLTHPPIHLFTHRRGGARESERASKRQSERASLRTSQRERDRDRERNLLYLRLFCAQIRDQYCIISVFVSRTTCTCDSICLRVHTFPRTHRFIHQATGKGNELRVRCRGLRKSVPLLPHLRLADFGQGQRICPLVQRTSCSSAPISDFTCPVIFEREPFLRRRDGASRCVQVRAHMCGYFVCLYECLNLPSQRRALSLAGRLLHILILCLFGCI